MWPPWSSSPSRVHTTPNPFLFRLSSFKDLQSLCQEEPPQSHHPQPETQPAQPKKASIFHRVRISTSLLRNWTNNNHRAAPLPLPDVSQPPIATALPGIVVYFTSLRVVRKTFEDCRAVRSILKGFQALIDERDLSMEVRFLNELQRILGQKKVTPPCVFIGGRHIGGADEIRQMNETGELKKLIQQLQLSETSICDECGGHRYVVCKKCDGSHKIYAEKFGGFKSCLSCSQNGLIRCPSCSRFPRVI